MFDRKLFSRWVCATWIGWLFGIPLVVVFALIGEAVGIGGSQVLVGAGMGTGVGLMQARVIKGAVDKWFHWVRACAVGLALPFLVSDISRAAEWNLPYSLPVNVIIGGIIAGAWQTFILRSRFRRTWLWTAASALGWTLAAGTAAIADSFSQVRSVRGILGALLYLGIVAAGGLVLGFVTGVFLQWMFRNESAG